MPFGAARFVFGGGVSTSVEFGNATGTTNTDGNFTIMTITGSGNIVIDGGDISAEVLAMAGGGAGGAGYSSPNQGGGGGAGGLFYQASRTITSGTKSVTIGAGGNGVSSYGDWAVGNNGGDTTFDGLTCKGGGRAGAGNSSGAAGGSGGGGGGRACCGGKGGGSATQNNLGTNTGGTGYGHGGGTGWGNNNGGAGGGGAGNSGSSGGSGGRGTGRSYNISGSSKEYSSGAPGRGTQTSDLNNTYGHGSMSGSAGKPGAVILRFEL